MGTDFLFQGCTQDIKMESILSFQEKAIPHLYFFSQQRPPTLSKGTKLWHRFPTSQHSSVTNMIFLEFYLPVYVTVFHHLQVTMPMSRCYINDTIVYLVNETVLQGKKNNTSVNLIDKTETIGLLTQCVYG